MMRVPIAFQVFSRRFESSGWHAGWRGPFSRWSNCHRTFQTGGVISALVLALCGSAFSAGAGSGQPSGESVQELLKAAEVRGGLVVQLGCDDGDLLTRLGVLPGTLVQGLECDQRKIVEIRDHIHEAGLAGTVSVSHWDGKSLPYIDNLVNVIMVSDVGCQVSGKEIERVLAPRGVCIALDTGLSTLDSFRKPVPTDTDEWTHFMHGPDNNPVARDSRVDCPEGLQWIESPLWTRDHDSTPSVFGLVSAKGRLFYILDEGPIGIIDGRLPSAHSLVARDAHNGVLLWKRSLPDWYPSHVQWGTTPIYLHRRLVAVDNRVYVTDGLRGPVIALDAASGKRLHTFAGTEETAEILVDRGVLVAGIMKTDSQPGDENPPSRDEPFKTARLREYKSRGSALVAFDVQTGETFWRRPCEFIPSSICTDGTHLFYSTSEHLACVELRSGELAWQSAGAASKPMVHNGVLVTAMETEGKRWTPRLTLQARSAQDGTLLWQADGATLPTFANCFYIPPEYFIANNLVWIRAARGAEIVGLDLHNGERKRAISLEGAFTPGHHVRCYPAKATERFALFNKRGIEFMDFSGKAGFTKHDWVRGACRLGILPSNGMIYVPPNGCNCCVETYVRGFQALNSEQPPEPVDDATRLERGPAFASLPSPSKGEEDWPTFRHDPARSSATNCDVNFPLRQRWCKKLSGRVTSPVASDGRLAVSEIDARTVHALDAESGDSVWSFVAGGRVDSPPTFADGLAVFGAADGCIYCLRSADGALVWRFQAAPTDRRLVAFGQVESVWPSHGSVLVRDGVVYLTAGRSSYLDGGIHLYALDLRSGDILHRQNVHTIQPQETTMKDTFNNWGALTDILVSDGDNVFMRHLRFDERLNPTSPLYPLDDGNQANGPRVMATSGFLDDSGNKRVYRACSDTWTGRYSPLRTQQLATNEKSVFGCRIHFGRGWKSPRYHAGDGTLVFAQDHVTAAALPKNQTVEAAVRGNGARWDFSVPRESFRWCQQMPVYARATVLAGDKLLVAGQQDRSVEDAITAMDGGAAGALFIFSASSGKLLHQQELPASPMADGMIVAGGSVYISTDKNQLLCLDGTAD